MIEEAVVNAANVEEIVHMQGRHGGAYKVLTPSMRPAGGSLGLNETRLPPGMATVPFHFHMREDEIFYVLRGRGVLRFGDGLKEIGPGDCISCPAGTKIAHQIANPFEEDLVYLNIGPYDPHEVCVYPDNGKTLVRSLGQVGFLSKEAYLEGEPDVPRVFELIDAARADGAL